MTINLKIAFLPLNDAAVLVAARERGFAEDLVKRGVSVDESRRLILDQVAAKSDETRTFPHVSVPLGGRDERIGLSGRSQQLHHTRCARWPPRIEWPGGGHAPPPATPRSALEITPRARTLTGVLGHSFFYIAFQGSIKNDDGRHIALPPLDRAIRLDWLQWRGKRSSLLLG